MAADLQGVEHAEEPSSHARPQLWPRLGIEEHQQGPPPGRHLLHSVVVPLDLQQPPATPAECLNPKFGTPIPGPAPASVWLLR